MFTDSFTVNLYQAAQDAYHLMAKNAIETRTGLTVCFILMIGAIVLAALLPKRRR